MEKIKLVIWDLDETLWEGTLSEGDVKCSNPDIIVQLAEHGIINSISSKNDYDKAKAKLVELGIWDYFVFPSINWNPKGEAIKQIIEDCQLRAPNVMFVDDNPSNLKEAVFYNQGIMTTASVAELQSVIDWEDYKKDEKLTRLKQYKLLEQKKEYRETKCTSNIDFLIKSNIRIQFIQDLEPIKERLVEMIGRTNQLNYTKQRIGMIELEQLLADKNMECAALKVVDNFGDYGICGFYALNKAENRLIHFLFSCRIMNLGVESYVYDKLGKPQLTIVEPVSSKLDDKPITWIHEDVIADAGEKKEKCKYKLALIGGCDLDQLCHYLENEHFSLIKDFNYPNANGYAVHREHTVYQRLAGNVNAEQFEIIKNLPFLDEKCLDFRYQKEDYDFLVFSPLMNYTQELYKHKKTGLIIAWGGYTNIMNRDAVKFFTSEQLQSFKEDFEFIGQQNEEAFIEDLRWLLKTTNRPIIFINGAEIDINNPSEIGACERHKK